MLGRTLIAAAIVITMGHATEAQTAMPFRTVSTSDAGAAPTTRKPAELGLRQLLSAKIYATKPGTAPTGSATGRTTPSTSQPTSGATNDATVNRGAGPPFGALPMAEWQALNQTYDQVGEVSDLIISDTGHIRQIAVELNPALGLGRRTAAVDWSDVNWIVSAEGEVAGVVDRNKLQIEAVPPRP